MIRTLALLVAVVVLAAGPAGAADEPFPTRPITIVNPFPIAYKDADEFKTWWDAEAGRLAEVIKKIGRVQDRQERSRS